MSSFEEHNGFRIRLAHLFILIAVAAIFTGWYWDTVPATTTFLFGFLLTQCAVCRVGIEALTKNVPRSIDRIQQRNCLRTDGTWSKRRARIEEKSRDRIRVDLAKAFLLIAIATNVAVWFVHSEVIPLPLAIDAISDFRLDAGEWKQELRDDALRLDGWMTKSSHLSPSQAYAHKRWLWKSWPIVLMAGIVWVAGCFTYLAMAYRHTLQELKASVQYRAEQYRLKALHESVGHDDFAKAKRRRKSSGSKEVADNGIPSLAGDPRM